MEFTPDQVGRVNLYWELLTMQEFIDTEDLAALLKVPAATVRYWRHTGRGPRGFRVGRNVRYRRADVDSWIAERELEERDARSEPAS